jgi:hypothetical protein
MVESFLVQLMAIQLVKNFCALRNLKVHPLVHKFQK